MAEEQFIWRSPSGKDEELMESDSATVIQKNSCDDTMRDARTERF
jgi:hypothetical protein